MKRIGACAAAAPALRAKGMPDQRGRCTTSTRTRSSCQDQASPSQQPSAEPSSTRTICRGKRSDRPETIEETAAWSRCPSLRTGITTLMTGLGERRPLVDAFTRPTPAEDNQGVRALRPLLNATAETVPTATTAPVMAVSETALTLAVFLTPTEP